MKLFKPGLSLFTVMLVGALAGCSTTSRKSADISGSIRTSLDQAGLKDVSVTQDRDKGVVTLGGHVAADADKSNAESIARSAAAEAWGAEPFPRPAWRQRQETCAGWVEDLAAEIR